MAPPPILNSTGARIAHERKTRHLTQRALADLSTVSYSTLTKIEQERLPASPSVLGALARALSVPVTRLTGQPYLEELRQDQLDGWIQPIREALNIYDLGPDPDVAPPLP
ncbi:transcriptional regulator with XRE-family HTH domain [Streptomyces zagrosensis]|uniref:Transcriptional regulator with XRE-family HTH domain n=1 Tax=Streptomyces zagrosensis TaxID=1042984 RepID=A0A7W9Q9N5_9ACTN|nr:helix-turn-helix transcriptional regulator [Streptomyces zagrosensis]MBB5936200.1 transcriptional regulator with XRE-family HTH domain [Streptomyces zagrosensis]